MPNWLSALGQSQAIGGFTSGIDEMKKQDLALKQGEQQTQINKLAIENAQHQAILSEHDYKKRLAEEERGNRLGNMTPFFESLGPKAKAFTEDILKPHLEYKDGIPYVRAKDQESILKLMGQPEIQMRQDTKHKEDLKDKIAGINEQIAKLNQPDEKTGIVSPDKKTMETLNGLQLQRANTHKELDAVINHLDAFGERLDTNKMIAEQLKLTEAQMKAKNALLQHFTSDSVEAFSINPDNELVPIQKKDNNITEWETFRDSYLKSHPKATGEQIVKAFKDISGQSMQLSSDALNSLSQRFGMTGEIPGMGMGKAATEARTKVLNKWASDLKNTGMTPEDQVIRQTAYKASKTELSKLQSQRGTVMAFANTTEKNLDLVSQLSEKAGRTGIPVINRWLLAGKRSLTGDPDVSKFDAAVRTAINEYAKVTSSATGGQVSSDSARKEVESMLNTAQTKEQVYEVIKLLRQEMQNRRSGYDEQIQYIKDNMRGVTLSPATSTKTELHKKYGLEE